MLFFSTLSSLSGHASDWAAPMERPYFFVAVRRRGAAMLSFIAKAAFAGIMVALVTVIAKKSPGWGGLLAALPITSILALSLLYADTGDRVQVAQLSRSIVAFILPSVPLFIMLPLLLRTALNFWVAMGILIVITLAFYAITFWALPRLGLRI